MSVSFDDFIVDVRSWLNLDADDAPTQLISNWVRATEPRIYRVLRIQLNELSFDIPGGGGNVYALPESLRSVTRVEIVPDTGSTDDLTRESRARIMATRKIVNGTPYNWCMGNAREVRLGGDLPESYTLRITGHGALTVMGEDGLGYIPAEIYDVYLYGVLSTASVFYSNDDDAKKYLALFSSSVDTANQGESNL